MRGTRPGVEREPEPELAAGAAGIAERCRAIVLESTLAPICIRFLCYSPWLCTVLLPAS